MYQEPLYRPPSEANSAIIQATLGCSHNQCAFCNMYKRKKFTILGEDVLNKHVEEVAKHFPIAQKIFVADGNALAMPFHRWMLLLQNIKKLFPHYQRVSTYATPKDILRKSDSELLDLRANGLSMIYLGIESGSDRVLKYINKGASREEIIQAGKKAVTSGFDLSVTVIAGLGGKDYHDHALETAKVINVIQPHFVSILSLMLEHGTRLYQEVQDENFKVPSTTEILEEIKLFLTHADLENTIFRSNHASNYLPLAGTLNRDRLALLEKIKHALAHPETLRPEYYRGL